MPTPDESSVLAVNRSFYDAFERLDARAMAAIWSEAHPVSCIHPSGPLVHGRDAVLNGWRDIFRGTGRIRFTLRGARVFVAKDAAWVVLLEEMEGTNGEATVQATTQATNIFVREGDGAGWRMVHHHAEPAQPMKPAKPKPASSLN